MLWGQKIRVYTDHQNLVRDALGLTSDRVYRWRLILEEYGPEIVYIHDQFFGPFFRMKTVYGLHFLLGRIDV